MSAPSRIPLYGLILAGGRSTRMQRDKAALIYGGKSAVERTVELATRHVGRVFLSVRPAQVDDPLRAGRPLIVDAVEGDGPIVGIRSAMAAHPQVAWLVLACDLPFLTDDALLQLTSGRDGAQLATAFRSTHDGLPEPLCAIWEPAAAAPLSVFHAAGGHCPRKFLLRHPTRLLDARDPGALDNINTPDEYVHASGALASRTETSCS